MSDEMDCDVCAGTGKPVSGLPCICGGTGSTIDEKAGLRRKVYELELQVSKLQEKLDVEDAAHDQTIMERDGFEETLTQLAADAGCTEEWSNLHAHGDCITNLWDAKVKALKPTDNRIEGA